MLFRSLGGREFKPLLLGGVGILDTPLIEAVFIERVLKNY